MLALWKSLRLALVAAFVAFAAPAFAEQDRAPEGATAVVGLVSSVR